jgi:group I intron endonuclease
MFCLYEITNTITNTKYIGCSKSVNRRWKEHITKLNNNTHENTYLQRSWIKYGADAFIFNITHTTNTLNEMYELETVLISNCDNKFNLASGGKGGDNITNHPNKDQIQKNMSISQQTRYINNKERSKCNAFKNLTNDEYESRCKKWSTVKKGPGNGRFKHDKPLAQIDIETNKIIRIYPYSCILKNYGFNGKYARLCAEGNPKYKTHKGYIWRYI